jgi:hypothetical protein
MRRLAPLLILAACRNEPTTAQMGQVRRLMDQVRLTQTAISSGIDDASRRRGLHVMARQIEDLQSMRPYVDPSKNETMRRLAAATVEELRSMANAPWERGSAKRLQQTCVSCHRPLGYPN